MGSFYSSCLVSKMTLTHQKTARILLVPSAQFENYDSRVDILKEAGMLVTNQDSFGLFTPFGFPIIGYYDDYGEIEDIEKDDNTALLEEYFGLDIYEILKAVSDYRWYTIGILKNNYSWKLSKTPNHIEQLLSMRYTDIQYDVYNYMSQNLQKSWNDKYILEEIDKVFVSKEDMFFEECVHTIIPHLCQYNFVKIFKIYKNMNFKESYTKMVWLYTNMSSLHILLMPANYGNQVHNFKMLKRLNIFVNKILTKEIKELSKDD